MKSSAHTLRVQILDREGKSWPIVLAMHTRNCLFAFSEAIRTAS